MKPREAWEKASCEVFEKGSPSQKKGCPKNAFIGIYDNTRNSKNANYARKAIEYLRIHPDKDIKETDLWKIIMYGEKKSYNNQMHVVMALYRKGLL